MDLIHVNLAVADVDRSVAFYTESFGFEETWGFEANGDQHRYVAADNGVELQLTEPAEAAAVDPGDGFQHLAVEVADVEETLDRVDHHGLVRGPLVVEAANARVAFVLDPDGYEVELVEPLDG